jgi:hypothetical protein
MERDLLRAATEIRSNDVRMASIGREEGPRYSKKVPRAQSAAGYQVPHVIPVCPDVHVRLFIFGEHRKTIEVPEDISRENLRRLASQEFGGSVAIHPGVIPVR